MSLDQWTLAGAMGVLSLDFPKLAGTLYMVKFTFISLQACCVRIMYATLVFPST